LKIRAKIHPSRPFCWHFVGIGKWRSPLLHQLRARAEKREQTVANVEFRSRGAAVDVDQICFELAPAPSFCGSFGQRGSISQRLCDALRLSG
jgi:hypothetical protein